MHCPNCGQQQVSDVIKFCSRCGMPLAVIAEVLANGGNAPSVIGKQGAGNLLTRKNGLKFSLVWFLLFTFVLTPIVAAAGAEPAAPILAILGTMGGMVLTIVSLMFLPKAQKAEPFGEIQQPGGYYPSYLAGNQFQGALPPPTSQPVESYIPPAHSWRTPDTGEMAPRPSSVTEDTTKLLSKDE